MTYVILKVHRSSSTQRQQTQKAGSTAQIENVLTAQIRKQARPFRRSSRRFIVVGIRILLVSGLAQKIAQILSAFPDFAAT